MATVKTEACGHGLEQISKAFVKGGVDRLCVAWAQEGVKLRHAGIKIPILAFSMNQSPTRSPEF